MRLLFLNAFKGLRKKKVQMLGIIFMVFLSTGIYTTMNAALDRMEKKYYEYLENQNVEHFAFDPFIDYQKDISKENLEKWRREELKDINESEKKIIDTYQYCLENTYEPCNNQNFTYMLDNLFHKYNLLDSISLTKIEPVSKKYDFTYEIEKSKTISFENYTYKAIPYDKEKKLNKPYLVDGKFPEKEGEITVLPRFASKNHLEIGDTYKIDGKKYKITGFAYAPDYIYPMLSMNSPIFDEKYNTLLYMNEKTYEKYEGVKEKVYVAKFNHKVNREDTLKVTTTDGENFTSKNPASKIFENEKQNIKVSTNTVMRVMRINAIQLEFETDRKFALYFLYLLLGISTFIILVITKKRIEDERLQIGVLKSLGYKSMHIAFSYLVYPMIGSIIGGILGFTIGTLLNGPLSTLYVSYFNVPVEGFKINLKYLGISIGLPFLLLSILSYIISLIMLRKKPLDLLKEGSHLKVNLFSKIISKITKKLPFESRFRLSLASRSFGKLFIVSLTSFCTGMLIVLVLIGINLFHHMIDKTFDSFKYKYQIAYQTIMTKESKEDDLILSVAVDLIKIIRNEKEEKIKKKENEEIDIIGMDSTSRYTILQDEKKRSLNHYLNEKGIIINKNLAEIYKIKPKDDVILNINGKESKYKVLGVTEGYLGMNIYINREELSSHLGFEKTSYNIKYSINKKYSSMEKLEKEEKENIHMIMSIDDLKRNINTQMQTMNSSIYIVIVFAAFMAFIIISVIANIVVEENKKTISLMKVLGYKNKEISSIVLNIYTPFVIFSYFLSIPVMICLLKAIIKALVGDIHMTIPITFSPFMAIIGLISLLLAYYTSLFITRKTLNKVPLSVALKRE